MARANAYLGAFDLDPVEVEVLGDLRRAFHLNNLAIQVTVLWTGGIDISGPLAVITERLEREQWFGPLLVEGARRAAVVAMHYYSTGIEAETKDDDSPMTDADRAVELMLRESLASLRPDDGILGEEFGRTGTSSRTWIIDPIDGTNYFAAGAVDWRVQLALEIDGELTVALVDSPATAERWWATAGGGAFQRAADGTVGPLAVSSTSSIAAAIVTYYPDAVADRLPAGAQLRRWQRLSLPDLVRGELEAFYVDCCQIWDHAPWVLLAREAGGRFTCSRGRTTIRCPDAAEILELVAVERPNGRSTATRTSRLVTCFGRSTCRWRWVGA